MTKPARDPVAGGVAALRRLTVDDTSAGDVTRARLLARVGHRQRRPWLTKKTALVVVLPLVASSALAATVIRRVMWSAPTAATSHAVPAARPRPPARRAPTVAGPSALPQAPPALPVPPATAPAPVPALDGDLNAYGVAHRAHFVAGDSARALRLWNAYLREFPRGRFVPEATYNRAITLVRLGRRHEAMTALRPLAAGRFGGYRQTEAQALLESLQAE